jgi:hypothetical protein
MLLTMTDLSYTLNVGTLPEKDKNGRWNKGHKAWNRGLTWNDMYDEETKEHLKQHLREVSAKGRANSKPYSKPVIQMDEDGNRLHWYRSSVDAANKLGLHARIIRKVCDGEKKHTGGFRWKWDERFLT